MLNSFGRENNGRTAAIALFMISFSFALLK
jgi:hypothetical protein